MRTSASKKSTNVRLWRWHGHVGRSSCSMRLVSNTTAATRCGISPTTLDDDDDDDDDKSRPPPLGAVCCKRGGGCFDRRCRCCVLVAPLRMARVFCPNCFLDAIDAAKLRLRASGVNAYFCASSSASTRLRDGGVRIQSFEQSPRTRQ